MQMENAIRRPYRLRFTQKGARTLEVTFPYEVVEREARKRGLTVEELLARFHAVAHFNGIDGVLYVLEEIPQGG